jgi:benzoyl-CoA reductase/2-hydroxyglutaryl-CoA dehydratase subunit BcrC/BadD/HgdB
VPTLRLETDFQGTALGQISTRLQAFAEMLGGGVDA